jgi:hypothetical protein
MASAYGERDYRRYRQAQRHLHATILGAPGHSSVPEAAIHLNDRLDRYGRTLAQRDAEGWAGDLAMNRRRLQLIRDRDTATYASMIRGRHASATPIIAELAGASSSVSGPRSPRTGRK